MHSVMKKRRKSDSKQHIQLNKCLNEKRRREQENIYIEELAELISASLSDMSSLSVKPDKCAILQETVKQIRIIKQQVDCLDPSQASDDLQASEVSSSRPTILANDVLGPLLLEALDGFLFIVNTDGLIEFVSENVTSFLKYAQSELVGKSIYNIIHVGDHPRFSSNLLPMSAIGNGFGWSETQASTSSNSSTSSAVSKSRTFNSRFMVKPQQEDEQFSDGDDSDPEFSSLMKTSTNSANNKTATGQTSNNNRDNDHKCAQQYENMQISAVLVPSLESKQRQSNASSPTPGTTASSSADDNCLVCVARRIPVTDKSAANVVVEQFTTRLDLTGKILGIDTSGVSSTYSQYLNKDLVGKPILELCHPNDFHRVQAHLKDALSTRTNVTSGIYRLMVTNDKYVHVQTKSKMFSGNPSVAEPIDYIIATHSIIRDSDNSCSSETSSSRGGTPSPITTSSWSGNPTFASTMSSAASSVANHNPSTNLISSLNSRDLLTSSAISRADSIPGPVIYANTQTGMISTTPFPPFPALSPSNVSDFSLNDCLGISEMFPSSSVSWDNYDTNSQESVQQQTSTTTSVQTVMASAGGQSTTSNNRTPTPTSAGIYTSVTTPPALVPVTSAHSQPQSAPNSQQTSPLCASSPLMANLVRSPSNPSPQSVHHNYNQSSSYDKLEAYSPSNNNSAATHKLRNLLTHGLFSSEEADSSPMIKKEMSLQNDNILRELLDQEDDDMSVANTPNAPTSVAQPHTPFSENSCPGSVGSDKKVANNNNMLRMLLNDDDIGKRSEIRKNHELVEQLLKDNDHHNRDPNSFLNQHLRKESIDSTPCSSSSSLPTSLNEVMATSLANKRKSIDDTSSHYESQMQDMKRPAPGSCAQSSPSGHSHGPPKLAGQNPMLASMLARTPTSLPEEISIPTSIISQTPDAKLPRNLEKKLIPTPLHPHPQQSGQVSQSGGQVIFTSVAQTQSGAQTTQQMMVPIVTNVAQLRPQQLHSFAGAQRLQIQPQVQQTIRLQEIHLQQIGPQSQTPVGHQLLHHQQQQQQIQQQNSSNFLNRILSDGNQNPQQAVRALMQQQQVLQQQPQHAAPAPQQPQSQQPQTPVAATTAQNAITLQQFYHQQQQQQQPTLQTTQPSAQQPIQSAANPPQLSFEESASDPYLSSILDDFISMQQEMNLDVSSRQRQTPVQQQNEDVMLLRILEEVIEPSAPNVATPTTPVTPADLNERMAISAIQKQLMSFEVTTPTTPNVVTSPFPNLSSATAPNYQQIPPPAYTPTTYGQQIANSAQQITPPAPANFQLQPRAQGPRIPKPRQNYLPQNMQLNPNLTQVAAQVKQNQLTPHQRRSMAEQRKMMAEQQKRLLAQQSQQQMIPQTQQTETMSFTGFPENMNELLNNSVAPNVALTVKPRPPVGSQASAAGVDAAQLSPRYAIPITAVSSPLPQSPAPQLSPGPRAPFSPAQPAAQQSYPSPSGSNYPTANQHRMSPHFASSPSPATAGPNSPLMQMSPQTNQWPQAVRPQTQMSQQSQQSSQNVNLQQTNPMLNAQLSGNGPTYPSTGQRFAPRAMRAAAPPQPRNARSSPYQEQFNQQFVGQQSIGRPPQRMSVSSIPSPMRVNSPRFPSESSLPSPSYQSVQSYSQQTDQFNFDQSFGGSGSQPSTPQPLTPQSVQQSDRTRNNSGMTSEYVKGEIRSLISGRTQQQQQQIQAQGGHTSQQQQHQQLSLSSHSLTLSSADLDMFSLLNDNSDDFTQGLLNIGADNTSAMNSPVSHLSLSMNRNNSMDDSKPTDQKKSLLQQLLSEPS